MKQAREDKDDLWYLQVPHQWIVYLIWIVEGYEGLAVPRVLEKERGIVELLVAPDLERELERVLADLAHDFPIQRISRPEGVSSIADDELENELV